MPSFNPIAILSPTPRDRRTRVLAAGAFALAAAGGGAHAEGANPGHRFEPYSNSASAPEGDVSIQTFLKVTKPLVLVEKNLANHLTAGLPPYSGYAIETPASLQCVYGFAPVGAPACNPNQVSVVGSAGSGVIAIVDAYDYPAAQADLSTFSAQFALPAPNSTNFQVVYANGRPANGSGSGWDLEAALDIEYAHATAPSAKIILVEARSSGLSDLLYAVQVAANLVAQAGGGQVSMSWGGSEFASEANSDQTFAGKNVVFYAAAGDGPGTIYPCVASSVVCVGGTSNMRDAQTFAFKGQLSWGSTGGGPSLYEPVPGFQQGSSLTKRGAPDVAALADPNNGVWVYNTTYERGAAWWQVGGTSAATPITAGLDNAAGNFAASSAAYLQVLYANRGAERTDVTSGVCGNANSFTASQGWDFCTGFGVPRPLVSGLAKL
ncbi:MAG: S53 family peptidase [Methylocystis sp.]